MSRTRKWLLAYMSSVIAVCILALLLAGCAYNVGGQKIPREVYRTEAAQELMTLAVAADREYDSRNPIMQPPAVCQNPDQTSMSGIDLAYCAMAMATYNAQLQLREQHRKAQVAYARSVLDGQRQERMENKRLWLNNPVTAALAGRLIGGSGSSDPGGSGNIIVNGGKAGGAGCVGRATDVDTTSLCGSSNVGDQTVVINTGNGAQAQGGGGTFTPSLEWATDMGSTRPVYDPAEGATVEDNRRSDDRDTLGLGEVL